MAVKYSRAVYQLKNKRRSALKHALNLGKGLTLYFTDEGIEQKTVADWLRWRRIMFIHPANEARRHRLEAISLKLLGLEPGVADIIIFDTPPHRPHMKGCCIEMKSAKGKPTSAQVAWLDEAEKRGFLVCICYSADEAIGWLQGLGY
jgi:hypothetical protein